MNLNEQVAKALGWANWGRRWMCPEMIPYEAIPGFATSHAAFHSHVIPYMVKHNLMDKWAETLCQIVEADQLVNYGHELSHLPAEYGTDYEGVGITHLATLEQMCEAFLEVVQDA